MSRHRRPMGLWSAASLLLAAGLARAAEPGEAPSGGLPDVVARVRPAVGAVGTYNPAQHPPVECLASGFCIDPRGYFVTACHVLNAIPEARRATDLRVFLFADSDRRGRPAVIVAQEPRFDVAIVKVEGGPFQAIKVGDSTKAREGQAIALCGYPFAFLHGLNPSTSAGIISSIGPVASPVLNTKLLDPATIEALRHPFNVFQLDATAYPGHSGAPLFDARTGEVLGVINSGFIRKTREKVISSGFTYAIPIHLVKRMLDDALAGKATEPKPDEGEKPKGESPEKK